MLYQLSYYRMVVGMSPGLPAEDNAKLYYLSQITKFFKKFYFDGGNEGVKASPTCRSRDAIHRVHRDPEGLDRYINPDKSNLYIPRLL